MDLARSAPSLCLVAFHFGPWPPWLRVFVETCRWNPSVGWLLVTDQPEPPDLPPNVRPLRTTVAAVNDRAARVLGLPARFTTPYKLCDLRPAFGLVFADELAGYAFWGVTDLDVVYGDLRAFLTPDVLSNCDVLAGRAEYLAGHFTLFRNAPAVNRLFEHSADHARVFTTEAYAGFDECAGLWHELRRDPGTIDRPAAVDSMTHVVRRRAREGGLRACFAPLCRERMDLGFRGWCVRWERGRLSDATTGTPFMYFHLNVLKHKPFFNLPTWQTLPERFTLSHHGFREAPFSLPVHQPIPAAR